MIQIEGYKSQAIAELIFSREEKHVYGLSKKILSLRLDLSRNHTFYEKGEIYCVCFATKQLLNAESYYLIEDTNSEMYLEYDLGNIWIQKLYGVDNIIKVLLEEREKVRKLEKLLEEKDKDIELYRSTREFIEDFEKLVKS